MSNTVGEGNIISLLNVCELNFDTSEKKNCALYENKHAQDQSRYYDSSLTEPFAEFDSLLKIVKLLFFPKYTFVNFVNFTYFFLRDHAMVP